MKTFEDLIYTYVDMACPICRPYSPAGKSYYADREFYSGNYWYYESADFIVDIHDFHIKKDYIENDIPSMAPYVFLSSSYILSGSGEWFNPYQAMEPSSVFIMDTTTSAQKYILHANTRFFVVGMKFRKTMLENTLCCTDNLDLDQIPGIFIATQQAVTRALGKIAEEIIHCRMTGLAADLFFEAKAKEWLSITLDAFEKTRSTKPALSSEDQQSIEDAARYIEDHYAFDIPQSLLEKIACMSGTKLKETFKQRYKVSITEFTQRKRMNVAENLLLTTDLETRAIAKAVGYSSASRFSSLFKRYKGLSPHMVQSCRESGGSCKK